MEIKTEVFNHEHQCKHTVWAVANCSECEECSICGLSMVEWLEFLPLGYSF